MIYLPPGIPVCLHSKGTIRWRPGVASFFFVRLDISNHLWPSAYKEHAVYTATRLAGPLPHPDEGLHDLYACWYSLLC